MYALRIVHAHPSRRAAWWRGWRFGLALGRSGPPSGNIPPRAGAPIATPAATATAATSSGESAAFEHFFRAHEPRISGYLWRVTGDAHLAADLSQETFLRAWRHFAAIQGYERPEAWLFRVATNLALQALRRRGGLVGGAASLGEWDLPGASDPGRQLAERDAVREALLALPPKQRALLALREVYGLSGAEVAATMGLSREAAKVALWRARAAFRAAYEGKNGRA
ncbi:MAG TPA: RNA polymerase sigma factor [Ktedonobacterales bacterium]